MFNKQKYKQNNTNKSYCFKKYVNHLLYTIF